MKIALLRVVVGIPVSIAAGIGVGIGVGSMADNGNVGVVASAVGALAFPLIWLIWANHRYNPRHQGTQAPNSR